MNKDVFVKKIIKEGTLTGSRCFGLETLNSDWDYFMDDKFFKKNKRDLEEHKDVKKTLKYNKFKNHIIILWDKRELHIIGSDCPTTYETWKYATNEMRILCENPTFKRIAQDKKFRIEIFNRLRELYRPKKIIPKCVII